MRLGVRRRQREVRPVAGLPELPGLGESALCRVQVPQLQVGLGDDVGKGTAQSQVVCGKALQRLQRKPDGLFRGIAALEGQVSLDHRDVRGDQVAGGASRFVQIFVA